MLFFINLLTCNLGKRLDLLFKFNAFFRGGSEVAEASVDLAWPDLLQVSADFLVRRDNTFYRSGWCLM